MGIMQESGVPASSNWRVLGEAFGYSFIAPVLLFALFLGVSKLVDVRPWPGFVFLVACGAAEFVALAKLRKGSKWKFGFAKISRYLLMIIAFLLLFGFLEWTVITGYYIIYPGAPPLFGGL